MSYLLLRGFYANLLCFIHSHLKAICWVICLLSILRRCGFEGYVNLDWMEVHYEGIIVRMVWCEGGGL